MKTGIINLNRNEPELTLSLNKFMWFVANTQKQGNCMKCNLYNDLNKKKHRRSQKLESTLNIFEWAIKKISINGCEAKAKGNGCGQSHIDNG